MSEWGGQSVGGVGVRSSWGNVESLAWCVEAGMVKWMESGTKRGRQSPRIEQGRGQAPGTGGYWLVCVEHKALAGCGLLAAEHSPPPVESSPRPVSS